MKRFLPLLALTAFACGEPPSADELLSSWPQATYDTSAEPRAMGTLPDTMEAWDELTLPLPVEGEDSGAEGILYSLSLGHYWLVKNQHPSGDYLYDWDAKTGESSDTTSSIQMLATAWSQVLLYRFLERDAFLIAAYRAMSNQLGRLRVEGEGDAAIASASGSLANTAFLLFTMVEFEDITKTGRFDETLEQMGRFMRGQVSEDGCMHTRYPKSDSCADEHSEFPVGQGLVALERMWRHTGDVAYLDGLERAVKYYHIFYRDAETWQSQEYFIYWGTGPIVALLLERPNPEIEAWVYEMNDWKVEDQYQPPDNEDYVGGFKKRSWGTPNWSTVSHVEGIIDAYRLAKARGDTERTESYRRAGLLAAKFLLRFQYRKDNVEGQDLADPMRAIGAYHFGLWDASSISQHYIRTDYMDHFAVTLLKAVSYLEIPEIYPGEGFAPGVMK